MNPKNAIGVKRVIAFFGVKGYSLLEVMVAVFLLAGLMMATFSIFESGGQQTIRLENTMVAGTLAQQVSEELHTKGVLEIGLQSETPFDAPFNQYIYSVKPSTFVDSNPIDLEDRNVIHLTQVSVTVVGPVDSDKKPTPQAASAILTMLLGRQPFP